RIALGHRRPHLALNLFWIEQIVGIEPLDVITFAQGKQCVARRGSALILPRDNFHATRLELPGHRQGIVNGAVVHHYKLFERPCLRKRRPNRVRERWRGVVSWNQNRNEWEFVAYSSRVRCAGAAHWVINSA